MTSVFVTTGALGCAFAIDGPSMRMTAASAVNRMTFPSAPLRLLWSLLFVTDAELLQRFRRTAIPPRDGSVAHVLQVIDAHPGRPEAARGEIAEVAEERRAV